MDSSSSKPSDRTGIKLNEAKKEKGERMRSSKIPGGFMIAKGSKREKHLFAWPFTLLFILFGKPLMVSVNIHASIAQTLLVSGDKCLENAGLQITLN